MIFLSNSVFLVLSVQDLVVHLHILCILTDFSLLNFILSFNTKLSYKGNQKKNVLTKIVQEKIIICKYSYEYWEHEYS